MDFPCFNSQCLLRIPRIQSNIPLNALKGLALARFTKKERFEPQKTEPVIIHFQMGFSTINQPFISINWGTPMDWKRRNRTSCRTHSLLLEQARSPHLDPTRNSHIAFVEFQGLLTPRKRQQRCPRSFQLSTSIVSSRFWMNSELHGIADIPTAKNIVLQKYIYRYSNSIPITWHQRLSNFLPHLSPRFPVNSPQAGGPIPSNTHFKPSPILFVLLQS